MEKGIYYKAAENGQDDREIIAKKVIQFSLKRDSLHFKGDWLHFKNFNKKFADICNKPIEKLR